MVREIFKIVNNQKINPLEINSKLGVSIRDRLGSGYQKVFLEPTTLL